MSRHKLNFQCFNAVGGEGSHKSSHPLDHPTTRLPKIPQHGMAAYHELEQECCLCSTCRHAHTLNDVENQLLPFYHAHPPYHHHHLPHQYVLSGPSRYEDTHSANDCHLHHQIYNKKIVLVKNSDPSFRKTIMLHRKGLRSFGLFLEEVSELMQYHIRKLYTQEGCKIDSIQSLLQCPGVVVCVGQEPSHPLVMEDFEKTSSYKLPKLSGKSCRTEHTDRNERLTTKTSTILPNLGDDKRATKHSVSSDKSVPDGRDSQDFVNSCPPSGNSVREDDIEKQVRVNEDGSLSMEMKVCFRLPNDETLHWSTTVKKTAGRTYDHIKAHNDPNLAQISDVNCSESEIMSADEAYFTQHYQGHKEKPHCPYCCSHCQGHETWKNLPGAHGARRCSHTSSSSASSRTVVSRKTVIEKQTMSRSSEELADQVVKTCITESIEAAEMVEFCTIQRETCSPKCNVKKSTVENGETTGLYMFPKNVDLKTAQESNQKEEEEPGSATCAGDVDDGSFSQISNPDRKETNGSEVLDSGLPFPNPSQVPKDKASKTSEKRSKPKTSKPSHTCHCGEPEGVQIEPKEKNTTKDLVEGQMQKVESSAMSVKSHAAWSSYKLEEIQKVDCSEEGRGSKSAMSVNSNASTNCSSAVLDVSTEGFKACDDKEKKERTSSSLSVKSFKSTTSVKGPPPQHQPEDDVEEQAEDDSEVRTQSSLSALSSVSAELKNIVQEESEEEDNQVTAEENEDNSAISRKYNSSRTPEDKTEENLEDNQVEGGNRSSLMSATSGKSLLESVSPTSRTSVRTTSPTSMSAKSRESKTPELYDTKKADITENDNTEDETERRPQSKLSVKSKKSVKSNTSAKSNKFNQTNDYYCNITETPDISEARASSVASEASTGSKSVITTEQNSCGDNGTTERAGSVMSVKSGQSHTSVVSLKSETSQISTTHSGHLCDERNDLYATAGRSSCMSDKSIKSNISTRSSNPKVSDKLNKDNVPDEEQRGSSAMSTKSNVTTESTFSKASGKSNLSKQSDAVEGASGDHTEQRERAPSNISTASAQSSKSHASAACIEEDGSEVCCNPSDRIFNEEEIKGRSVSSMSVQSFKSNMSLRSGRTNCSTCTQAADATESFLQDSEEMNPENKAENCTSTKSVESQTVRPASATSTKSKNSTKSTKSNTSNICSSRRPGEDATEEAIPERALSVLSVRSTKSTSSIESTKSKCSIHDRQEKSSGQENDKELLQERPTSKGSHVSERSVKSAERPHSVSSDKSKVSDIESCASVEISDNRDCENATEQRAQSALSKETVRSTTPAKSTKAAEHDELHKNITNNGEMVERAASNMSSRSEKSTKSNISTISKRSKVDTGCLEAVCPNERVVEGENECRSVSPPSIDSIVSTKSNKSMHSARGEEDGTLVNEEERPPSNMSAKSIQSCVSEISIKSAGRTPSSLSAKSVKTSTTEACSGKCLDESNIEEAQARAESVMSSKTETSTSSAKSNKSKGLSSRADENMVDDNGHVETSPSNLSIRSEKSTKSNASKGSKRLKVSKICLENEAADSEERVAGNGSEDKPLSPQSVRSNTSIKSNKLKRCTDAPIAKRSDNFNSDIENDKEVNIERAPSRTSTISIQSSVSEISIKSEERAASGLSEKSHASVISDLKNNSQVPSEIPAPPNEVGSEDEEKTNVMSVKSINSSVSDKSNKSASLDCEKHTERSSSNLSVKSGRSAKSNASKRSKVYEVDLENSADNSDVRIVEGESEGSTISVVSAQSIKSECERCDDEHENPERPPRSTSAKSIVSHISEKSAKSANRPPSASSAKSAKSDTSAKSVNSNISDAMSGKTVESKERTNSVLSSKTAKSATSTKSSKVKKHTSPTEEDDWENEDRNTSSMSARSVTSVKSNISKVSEEPKASAVTCELNAKSDNEDDCQEEHNESRSMSSMSIHSVKSDISARSDMLKCSSDIPVQELITRSNSPASVISIKSNSSGVFSDTNRTEERTDNKASQDRSESAMSETECICSLDQVERPASNLSVNSAKSAMSNVTGTSTKSKTSNIRSEHEQEITASDIEEEGNSSSSQVTKSNVSKRSRCSDVAATRRIETPNGDNSDETMQDRAESCASIKTGCSHVSERSIGSKAFSQDNEVVDEHEKRKDTASNTLSGDLPKSLSTESEKSEKSSGSNTDDVPADDYVAESDRIVERAGSQVSDRSAKSKSSTKSKRSTGGDLGKENSKEDSLERPLSCMSTSSVTESVEQTPSTRSSKSNISRISATVSQVSDTTLNDENTNERSSSNISTNVKTSSKVTTPSEVTSVEGTSNGEGKTQRPPSTLSAKSAKSSKSSKSTKSSKLQNSNKPDEEISVEDMKRPPSNSSIKSTISRNSDGRLNNSEILAISPENVADENTDDIEIKTLSPVSAKSLKTNVSSVSTKSKASHSQKAKEDQSHSVLSIKSDTSSRTIESNGSCITPREETGMDEDNESEAKSSKLIDPDIPKEESNPHNDGNASEKSEGTQSRTSTKSRKSKNSCVPVEESSTYVEERAFSNVSIKSAKSDPSEALSRSEVPSVTIVESENRSPTATSSTSKASGRSKKSRTSEIHGSKSSRKSQSSLSVHSHMSAKSKKNNVTDVSTASVVSENTEESVTPSEVKEDPTDKRSSKTNRSREQGKEDAGICLNKHPVICHADSDESDLSQTLSCSDKEICETSSPGKSKSHVSDRIVNGSVEDTDTVSDKSDKGSKNKEKDDAGDFELVPSILPNTSPTEVVNEWLKTLPTERDLYEMEENSDGVKDNVVAEETDTAENAEKNESEAENSKGVNGVDNVQNDCQTCLETPTEGNTCTQREDGSARFNSSIQVMKVLLNPKLDRCNSLPEISPVYGRKLSTSAQGLLDCLVKLQLIDHDPKNANDKNKRYQELMSILQSLWLYNPSEEEHVQNTSDHHSVEGEYNHTSSSGVDVNSGSTGSGKSSDGVKSSNNLNIDGSQPRNSLIAKTYNETDVQWKPEIEEVNQEEEDPATDETIRSNDSPREPPETPSSSNKSSGESNSNDEKLSKKLSPDSDPVWVLTLLNKIEKQFMAHYITAMKELKVRWSLGDTDQLDTMIDELKTEVHNKIQISIDKEVRKIQGKAGLPRPPTEAASRTSNKQREKRRPGVKLKLQQSMDSQGDKSDSTTGTLYSDQRGENIDEYCPCEACVEQNLNSIPPLSTEVRRTAPVVMDYDLKRILLMKTAIDCAAPCGNDDDTITAETLVEKVIIGAIKEVEINKMQQVGEEAFEFTADEKEADDACQDDQTTIEESVQVFAVDNEEKTGKEGVERPGSESGAIHTEETPSEEATDDAITPGGENGLNVNSETTEKYTDMLSSMSEDEEEITVAMPVKYITASTKQFPNHANEVHDDTVAFANTEVQSKEETEKDVSVEASLSTKPETCQEDAKKDWVKLRRKLLPSVQIILHMKNKKQSMMNAKTNDNVRINEMVKDQTEEEEEEEEIEEESEAETDAVQDTLILSENEPSEEIECSETENKEPAVEVSVAQTSEVKSSEEENDESFLEVESNTTLSEDEKEAMETSSIATSEHTPVAILTKQKSDLEEVGEGTSTTSDQDAAEESGGSSDEDESEDEREATINELSSIQEEETTADELSVASETELQKNQVSAVGYEGTKKNDEAESEVQASEREEFEEDSTVDQEETISPVNTNDSPDESEAAVAESSGESDEGATTADETDVEKQTAVRGEDEAIIAASPGQSDCEKAKEAGQVNPQEDTDAEVRKGSSTESEDENEESETAISEHKSEKDSAEEEGTDTDEEKLPAVSADEFADENRDSLTEDESSEDNKEATTEDEIPTDKEIFLAQNGESKDVTPKEEATAKRTENEEAGTVDDEETGTASESGSGEDINGTTNDDDNAEENDDMSSELSIEYAENQTKDNQTGEEATVKCTSVHKFEEAEEEEAVDCKEETGKVKRIHGLVLASEAEDDQEEDEIDADTTENESGKDEVEETTSRQGSDSEDETNEEKEDKLKEEQRIKATDAEEEDMVKSKSDSVEDDDASSNDETSTAEAEHEINKAYNVANEKESAQTSGGEVSDASSETNPESTIEGSSKAVSENESEAEGSSSAIDDEKSANNLRAGKGEATGQEDTSTVKDNDDDEDESGEEDSDAQSEDEVVDATPQECTDESESLSQAEPVEQLLLAKELESSEKLEERIKVFQEERSKDDKTPLEESESVENESDSESKSEDCSEALTKGQEDYKLTDEDVSEVEMIGSEITKSDCGEKSRSKDQCDDKCACEESADEAEDESVEEKEPQFTENKDATAAALNDHVKDPEKEDEDTDTPIEGWSGSLGDSADGEDEAEEDSEPEEDTADGEKPFVADKLGSLDATKKTAKKTLLIPLDALMKERAESEDGAFADIEDSETEIHDQDDVTSLESKSLKKL